MWQYVCQKKANGSVECMARSEILLRGLQDILQMRWSSSSIHCSISLGFLFYTPAFVMTTSKHMFFSLQKVYNHKHYSLVMVCFPLFPLLIPSCVGWYCKPLSATVNHLVQDSNRLDSGRLNSGQLDSGQQCRGAPRKQHSKCTLPLGRKSERRITWNWCNRSYLPRVSPCWPQNKVFLQRSSSDLCVRLTA